MIRSNNLDCWTRMFSKCLRQDWPNVETMTWIMCETYYLLLKYLGFLVPAFQKKSYQHRFGKFADTSTSVVIMKQ